MAVKKVRECDRCGGPNAETVVILIGAQSRREDQCPSCRRAIEAEWEKMPTPKERRSTRRLTVMSMADVEAAARAARAARRPQAGR